MQAIVMGNELTAYKQVSALYQVLSFSKDQGQEYEPFTEEEEAQLQRILNSETVIHPVELSECIHEKMDIEEREQD